MQSLRFVRSLRSGVRLVTLVLVTAVGFALWRTGGFILGARSARGLRWRRAWMRGWARVAVGIMHIEVEVDGALPPAPCVVVSNHLGYVDIPVYASCADLVFVSKVEVRDWPLIGRAAEALGTIFVDRGSRRELPAVNARIQRALESADRVLFFPEGTSTAGEGVLPFKSSLLEPAAQSGYPVYCAAVHYSTSAGEPSASEAVCWWGEMEFTPHILRLLGLSKIRARVVFHGEPHLGEGRKLLAERTERTVVDLHRSLTAI